MPNKYLVYKNIFNLIDYYIYFFTTGRLNIWTMHGTLINCATSTRLLCKGVSFNFLQLCNFYEVVCKSS